MNKNNISAVIGTNSWGGKLYGKIIRGNYVPEYVIKDAMKEAKDCGLVTYDLARDYGFGKAQKMIGEFGTKDIIISAKYTPFKHYKKGCVRKSLMKDLDDFKRDYVDIYWLHLPTDIEKHLLEIIELYKEKKIRYIGVSNFNLEECKKAKNILEKNGIPQKKSLMNFLFNRKVKKLTNLYKVMISVARRHDIKVLQVAIAFCASKGVIPMVGCRKPEQVHDLSHAADIRLSDNEIKKLEEAADMTNIKIMGADIFRPFVLKDK